MSVAHKSTYIPSILGLIALFGVAMAFIALPLRELTQNNQSLADPISLQMLIDGKSLPQPQEQSEAMFHKQFATPPALASLQQKRGVLGVTTGALEAEKRIEVDLSHQKVYAFEGNTKVYEFIISSGKWGRTPTGEFRIWTKVKSQLMKGGDPNLGTYYYLPNVPWVMFFYNDQIAKMRGFSFHGTYWHDNFGYPMSHGCVNMRSSEAKLLYDWASPSVTNESAWSTSASAENPGTRVIIYGEAPTE
jgi:lipoprotein-anchoring transpeptidase ErfK/SrfK